MSKQGKSLTDALADAPAPVNVPAPTEMARTAPAPKPTSSAARPDRVGKTNVTGYFDKPVKWELQELATERSRMLGRKVTVQKLLAEALNDLFKKYGRPEIAR
jgi:hypothetical protein